MIVETLIDIEGWDIDKELEEIVERLGYSHFPYIIMNKLTFKILKKLSINYDKKNNVWHYEGDKNEVPDYFDIAIDNKIEFGKLVIK